MGDVPYGVMDDWAWDIVKRLTALGKLRAVGWDLRWCADVQGLSFEHATAASLRGAAVRTLASMCGLDALDVTMLPRMERR